MSMRDPLPLQAQFNHVGTTVEYLYHLCSNHTLSQSLHFSTETAVQSLRDGATATTGPGTEGFTDCVIMCSELINRERCVCVHVCT